MTQFLSKQVETLTYTIEEQAQLIRENASVAIDQNKYQKRYDTALFLVRSYNILGLAIVFLLVVLYNMS